MFEGGITNGGKPGHLTASHLGDRPFVVSVKHKHKNTAKSWSSASTMRQAPRCEDTTQGFWPKGPLNLNSNILNLPAKPVVFLQLQGQQGLPAQKLLPDSRHRSAGGAGGSKLLLPGLSLLRDTQQEATSRLGRGRAPRWVPTRRAVAALHVKLVACAARSYFMSLACVRLR